MDFGLKLRQRARAKPPRRPAGRPGQRAPRATSDRPKSREGEPPSLWSIIGDAIHGLVFLGLTAAALIHFGRSFEVLAVVVAALSILSLKEAWTGLRAHLDRSGPGK